MEKHKEELDLYPSAFSSDDGSLPAADGSAHGGGVAPAAVVVRANTVAEVKAVRAVSAKPAHYKPAAKQAGGGGGAPAAGTAKSCQPLQQGPAAAKKQKTASELEEVVVCGECRDDCMTCETPTVNTSTIFTRCVNTNETILFTLTLFNTNHQTL